MSGEKHSGRERRGMVSREPGEGSKWVSRRALWVQCALISLAAPLVGGATAAERNAGRPERVALTARGSGLSNDRGRVAVAPPTSVAARLMSAHCTHRARRETHFEP